MKNVTLIILFFVLSIFTLSAQTNVDSLVINILKIGNRNIFIEVPYISSLNQKIDNYEEGTFVYYPFIDTSLLFIHVGNLVERPFYQGFESCTLYQEKKNDSIISFRGTCGLNYFREDYYKNYGVSVVYKNITSNYIVLFDFIIDNLRIYFCKED